MNYKKIEELFVDFILDIIGPNEERENERNNNLSIVQKIISKILTNRLPDYITYVLPYGSFPIKTYLKDADIDITIFLQSKSEKNVIIDFPINLIDKAILLIKDELERVNKESSFELFSDIKVIMAGIRLLKFKIGSISIDISINNFSGLFKILFINYIENQLKLQFNKKNLFNDNSYKDSKINIFRRTLLLIKGWCFYEGKLMGSNIGLMASYTLEILVIFLFNLHYENIDNEYDAFEKFFQLMNKFNWEKNTITLYGIISNFNFFKKLHDFNNSIQNGKENNDKNISMGINKPFWYLEDENNKNIQNGKENENEIQTLSDNKYEPLLNLKEIKKFISFLNNGIGNIFLLNEGNVINTANFDKSLNVLDPLNNHNNLGKSINYHSNSKMKIVISYINKKLKKIQEIRKKANPYLYINALLNLFKVTLTTSNLELFINSINTPEIIVNSKIYKKYHKEEIKNNKKITINESDIEKFNRLFSENPKADYKVKFEDEDFDECVEEDDSLEESGNGKSEIEEEEDKDECEEEEDEEKENKMKGQLKDEDIDENAQILEIKDNINFQRIVNNEIIQNLFKQNEKKQNSVKYNNKLLKESKEYSNKLEILLKKHKLI